MNGVHLCLWVLAAWLARWASLITLFEAHRGKIAHALRTLELAVAAAPRVIAFLALRVVEQAELLAIAIGALGFACATPVARWLHAVVSEVLELTGAVLCAEEARACVALTALRVAAIITLLFRLFAGIGRFARAPAIPLPKAVL